MKEKTLKILEYDRIISMLKSQAGSELTREAISGLMPVFDVEEIVQRQQETTEAGEDPLPSSLSGDVPVTAAGVSLRRGGRCGGTG